MIRVIPSQERHHGDLGWLSTYWHFSFSDYYDPANLNWGALRAFNDDTVRPGQGFGAHSHRDMEIITYVLEGALEHGDSLGNTGVLHPGEVQVMSAGKGITHSEYNHSTEQSVHFLQLWIHPRTRGLTPRWDQRRFTLEQLAGKLLPVVSGGHIPYTLKIDQDAAIYLASLPPGGELIHRSRAAKNYLFLISGELQLSGGRLAAGDQARIEAEEQLSLEARQPAELILLDLPT